MQVLKNIGKILYIIVDNPSVLGCTNDTKRTTKSDGITFHLFPKEPALRKAWVEALGMSEWEPRDRSTVCSQHFVEDDFYRTKCGLRKIKNGAVPISAQEQGSDGEGDLNQLATLRACRVCLCTNSKMYHIEDYNLKEAYEQLTGTPVQDGGDALPLALCAECAYRVALSARLRRQALRALKALSAVLHSGRRLSLADVRAVDRVHLRLQSTLAAKRFAPDHFDLSLNEDDALKTEPTDDAAEMMMDNGIDEDEETKASPLPPIAEVEVKPERHEAFLEECDRSSDTDDDRALSEVVSEARTERAKRRAKGRRSKRRHETDESPSVTADKYMKSDVKRRKTQDGPDESLFTVSRLSYEEQIEEVERRRESASYKNAAFKCGVCYRGFHVKERCDAHLVRHSEASGAYACFICKTRLRSARALRKHLTAQHTELYSCKGCSFSTRNRGVAREHERWHAGARYHCPHCAASFDKLTTYMGHVRIKHASDFVCELCGFTFVSRKGIDVHKKKKHRLLADATLAGPDCGLCGVRFLSHEAYARHLQLSSRHSAERAPGDSQRIRNDSQSASAGGAARRPRRERRAAADAASDAPVGCEQCGITLKDLRVYAQHFRRAHPDKNRTKYPAMKTPAMCELCGRIFQSMALLKDHMWVHTGEKRFKCERCDKSFTQKTNLVFHMRVHSAQRPSYECPLCGKHFAFYNNRRRHMFIHTGLKPHKCDTCGKSFTTAGEQKAHVEHVHLKKPWPKRARPRATAQEQSQQPQPSQQQMPWHKCAPED